jgi:hypothetical protein
MASHNFCHKSLHVIMSNKCVAIFTPQLLLLSNINGSTFGMGSQAVSTFQLLGPQIQLQSSPCETGRSSGNAAALQPQTILAHQL